jgi:hypothetical protein
MEVIKIKDRVLLKRLIEKSKDKPGLQNLYRRRLAIAILSDIRTSQRESKETVETIFKMIMSRDVENLTVAEVLLEQIIKNHNGEEK